MKTYQLIFLMIYLPLFNYGQNTLNNCLINENTDKFYDEVLSSYFPKSSSCRSSELPLRVSLKKYCPEVRQQDETSSNVGWAVGYSAMTITYAKQYEWTTEEINENALSPTFLSSQLRDKDCQAVFGIGEVLELASHRGNVFYKEFDAIYGYCNAHVSVFKMKPTYLFKLKDYLTLFSLNAYNKQKIYNTKKSISEGKPVIIGMKVLKNFENLTKKTPYWNPNIGDTNVLGGHAMVVVGYDESRGAFEVMNSWGKNWGNDGFIYIKYADYAKYCRYAYQIWIDEDIEHLNKKYEYEFPDTIVRNLSGSFYCQIPIFEESSYGDDIRFEKVSTKKVSDYTYEMDCKGWEIGQMYQLVTKHLKEGTYVYVFGIDADNQTMIHWPRRRESLYKSNLRESALVSYSRLILTIPGEETAMVKEYLGTDHIFVLHSIKKIPDLEQIIQNVKGADNFEETLKEVLGDKLIPIDEINYEESRVKFKTESSNGYIVPIILKIEGN